MRTIPILVLHITFCHPETQPQQQKDNQNLQECQSYGKFAEHILNPVQAGNYIRVPKTKKCVFRYLVKLSFSKNTMHLYIKSPKR